MSRTRLFLLPFAIFGILSTISFYTQGEDFIDSNGGDIIDACLINKVFCGTFGRSDLPNSQGSRRGIYSYIIKASSTLVQGNVGDSLPDKTHTVHLCPGTISNTGGFTGCRRIGVFRTDETGRGEFVITIPGQVRREQVLAINVQEFGTVMANCPDQPNAHCTPNFLYSPD